MGEFVLQYWTQVAFGLVTAGFVSGFKKVNKKLSEQESLKLGLQALLRDRIIQSYNHHMELGYVPIYSRENLECMAKEYFNLGGNGVIHQLIEKLEELPTEKPNKKVEV